MGDLLRSIPSIMDGLTPSQRKILFCAFKKPISQAVSVARLCDYASQCSADPHGEQSLVTAILCMMGKSNINLFYPIGQFGTCRMGGKNDSSVKDIKIRLSPITQHIFYKADEPLLNYLNENGRSIEPAWFIPIIPMVLVNGSLSIGPDCTSFVPGFNPKDIIANLKRLLHDEDMVSMNPWYKWFKLTDNEAIFEEGYMTHAMTAEELSERLLKKTLRLCTNNMNLLDSDGAMKKYDTPGQILEDFFNIRLEFYKKRKLALCQELENALMLLDNKVRFIRAVKGGKIIPMKKGREDLYAELKGKGFTPSPIPGVEYEYLMSMPTIVLFDDTVQQLLSEKAAKLAELKELTNTPPESLWLQDLDVLEKQLDEQDKRNEDEDEDDEDDEFEDDDMAEIV